MAYTDIDDPSVYFQTTLYTGNGGTNAITNTGNSDLQPDWIWFKRRDGADNNILFDVVRGVTKGIYSDLTNAEDNLADSLASFNSDGFTLGADTGSGGSINGNNETYASWQWKAGTSFTNDASGTSVGSIDSAGSVNTDAGFSIISYTGTGSNGTIAHGLGVVPAWIIHKRRDDDSGWVVWHKSIGTNIMELNETGAAQGGSSYINGTVPTSSVFSVGTSGDINASGGTYIAYCFAEKKGYSKFGSYVANSGGANSTFVYLGFKPAWIMVKKSSGTQSWYIGDNKRLGYNPKNENVNADTNGVEFSQDNWDVLSNGFKIKNNGAGVGTGGDTYIYMAFAEQPFVTSTGVPATAR
mgnify:CR=1 FL=1